MSKQIIVQQASSCSHHDEHDSHLEVILYFVGLGLFLIGLFLPSDLWKAVFYLVALVLSGYHIIFEGFIDTYKQTINLKKFMPNVHILMTLAAIGAIIIGEYMEATLLILIFAGAHYLEHYAESKSNKEITSLLELNPTTARRLKADGSTEIVNVSELAIGDHLSILNGDQIPTDGIVISGTSSVDQAAITGESIPVDKTTGDELFGITINGSGTLVMEVTKESSETVIATIIQLVSQTQRDISKTAAFIKRLEPKYVTVVLLLTPLFYLLGHYVVQWSANESFYRTMVFLIATSPCALAATDIPATLSAISHLAKRGVLFKGGSYLSNLADLKAVTFDKTGTLTEGKPVVTNTYFGKDVTEDEANEFTKIIVSRSEEHTSELQSRGHLVCR